MWNGKPSRRSSLGLLNLSLDCLSQLGVQRHLAILTLTLNSSGGCGDRPRLQGLREELHFRIETPHRVQLLHMVLEELVRNSRLLILLLLLLLLLGRRRGVLRVRRLRRRAILNEVLILNLVLVLSRGCLLFQQLLILDLLRE